jgi:hypothetical protein
MDYFMQATLIFKFIQTSFVILIMLFSGWLLIHLLYPLEKPIWKFSTGTGVSVVITGWITLIASYLPTGINKLTIYGLFVVLFMLKLTFYMISRRKNIGVELLETLKRGKVYFVPTIIFFVFLLFLAIGLPKAEAKNEAGYSEFYVSEEHQINPPWRQVMEPSERVSINFVVHSHEKFPYDFKIQVISEGSIIQTVDLGIIEPGQKVKQLVPISITSKMSQRFNFILLRGDSNSPYRSLFIPITVSKN